MTKDIISPAACLATFENWPYPEFPCPRVHIFQHQREGRPTLPGDFKPDIELSTDLQKAIHALGNHDKHTFRVMLDSHDRDFLYSDDYAARRRGGEEALELAAAAKKIAPETVDLFNALYGDNSVIKTNIVYDPIKNPRTLHVLLGAAPRMPVFDHGGAKEVQLARYKKVRDGFKAEFIEAVRDGANALWHAARDRTIPEDVRKQATRTSAAIGVVTGDPQERARLGFLQAAKMASATIDSFASLSDHFTTKESQQQIRTFVNSLWSMNNHAKYFHVAEVTRTAQMMAVKDAPAEAVSKTSRLAGPVL